MGHSAPNDLAAQFGGIDLKVQGLRNSQPVRYLATNTEFYFDDEGTPTGGFFWDGRADSLNAQTAGPLLGAGELANKDKVAVVQRIAAASWAADFKRLYGADVFKDVDGAFDKLGLALKAFQSQGPEFNAFTSKYDEVLRGKATLSAQEARGLEWFNDPQKGNCASCHPSAKAQDGSHPLFTDFTYDNLGVPRNPEILANADPTYFDLGLCARTNAKGQQDLLHRTDLCGAFKVPTLRNVDLRRAYFHNGRFKSLREALVFYVQRDTNPEKWYPKKPNGSVRKFDDLPPQFVVNVNTTEAPYDRKRGDAPALNDAEIDDVLAFLKTLTDGWVPAPDLKSPVALK
jgi:cytochrome c peroxidase